MRGDDASSNMASNYRSLASSTTNASTSSTISIEPQSFSFTHQNTSSYADSTDVSINDSAADRSDRDLLIKTTFPDDYKLPPLPDGLLKDVEDGVISKFGPHYSNRRILIDAIAHDLIHKYNLL